MAVPTNRPRTLDDIISGVIDPLYPPDGAPKKPHTLSNQPSLLGGNAHEQPGSAKFGAPRPKPLSDPSATAFFFGQDWDGADRAALERAKQDEAAGVSRNDIWRKHLWGRSPAGKWMTESDDSNVGFSDQARRDLIDGDGYFRPLTGTAKDRATPYPDRDLLRGDATSGPADQATTSFNVDTGPNGAYSEGYGTEISAAVPAPYTRRAYPFSNPNRETPKLFRPAPASKHYDAGSAFSPNVVQPLHEDHALAILMHERQHKADTMSGLMPPREVRKEVRKFHDYVDYEVRADAAAQRRPLTLDQRRALPPWQSYNVPEKGQFALGDTEEDVRVPPRFKKAYDEDQ